MTNRMDERCTCRVHGIAYDNGFIWQVCGTQKPGTSDYAGYTPGLVKYDIKTGRVVEQVDFVTGSADIHDVTINKRAALWRRRRRAFKLVNRRSRLGTRTKDTRRSIARPAARSSRSISDPSTQKGARFVKQGDVGTLESI